MVLTLAMVTATAPVNSAPRPTFMPGPFIPPASYTGYNPFKSLSRQSPRTSEQTGCQKESKSSLEASSRCSTLSAVSDNVP